MNRNIRDIRVIQRPLNEVQCILESWLTKNDFDILPIRENQNEIRYGRVSSKIKILSSPNKIIAVSYKLSGALVFEFGLSESDDAVIVHGEFYAAGAGPYYGKELDLSPQPSLLGRYPRRRGYILMKNVINYLESYT